jgi:molybdopterin-synthase adenylyltransferase
LEAVKILAGVGNPLFGQLWMIDGYEGRSSLVELRRDPDCPCCGGSYQLSAIGDQKPEG